MPDVKMRKPTDEEIEAHSNAQALQGGAGLTSGLLASEGSHALGRRSFRKLMERLPDDAALSDSIPTSNDLIGRSKAPVFGMSDDDAKHLRSPGGYVPKVHAHSAAMRNSSEGQSPVFKRLYEEAFGPTSEGHIYVQRSKPAPYILAHEMGHADIDRSAFGPSALRVAGIADAGRLAALPAGVLAGGLVDNPYAGAAISAAAPLAFHLPTLINEGAASIKGYRHLKGVSASPEQLRRARAGFARAWGSYAGVAGTDAGLGVTGYGIGRLSRSLVPLKEVPDNANEPLKERVEQEAKTADIPTRAIKFLGKQWDKTELPAEMASQEGLSGLNRFRQLLHGNRVDDLVRQYGEAAAGPEKEKLLASLASEDNRVLATRLGLLGAGYAGLEGGAVAAQKGVEKATPYVASALGKPFDKRPQEEKDRDKEKARQDKVRGMITGMGLDPENGVGGSILERFMQKSEDTDKLTASDAATLAGAPIAAATSVLPAKVLTNPALERLVGAQSFYHGTNPRAAASGTGSSEVKQAEYATLVRAFAKIAGCRK